MALSKREVVDQILVDEDGNINLRTSVYIEEDGVVVAHNFHRKALQPGDDLVNENARVQAIANADWTPARVQAAQQKRDEIAARRP